MKSYSDVKSLPESRDRIIELQFSLKLMNQYEASNWQLLAFGKQMHSLVYPLTYDGDGKPQVSAFSIQLDEVRAVWRRRRIASMSSQR